MLVRSMVLLFCLLAPLNAIASQLGYTDSHRHRVPFLQHDLRGTDATDGAPLLRIATSGSIRAHLTDGRAVVVRGM
jgi:hypothetical protein